MYGGAIFSCPKGLEFFAQFCMKLCFPVESSNGLDSIVYGHFGSAPSFVVFHSDTKEISNINNQNLGHEHGKCNPVQALNGQSVDAIVVGGIGAGAINKLNTMGIKVYQAMEPTVRGNIELFEKNSLHEISLESACNHHDGCHH